MRRVLNRALIVGLAAGYVVTVLQTTDGPLDLCRRWRVMMGRDITALASRCSSKRMATRVRGFLELQRCGWCLSPYVAAVMWLVFGGGRGLRWRDRLAGIGAATAVAAAYRHFAELY